MAYLDAYDRPIDYLRIAVTDRCNLRCVYCMPEAGVPARSHDEILRYEEIVTIVCAAAELGIHKVRLTGGEPLARLGIVDLVRMLARIPGIDDLAMTTNGTLLARHAVELAEAGLRRVNVSLDTLRADRFRQITRRGELFDTLAGIDAARKAGLVPVKINTVVIRAMNDDEVVDLARQTVDVGWHLRFIEWMPVGTSALGNWQDLVVTADEIRARVEAALGPLSPGRLDAGAGPARYYCLPRAKGTLGFITPVSDHFCSGCNRLRLTADGQLRPCLLSDREIDLRTPLRAGAGVEQIKALLLEGIGNKPGRHHLDEHERVNAPRRAMSQIGG
jgi:cyclic pyranopterin phosphate synthase